MLDTIIRGTGGIALHVLVTFGLWMIYKVIHDRLTSYDDDHEIASGNVAAGFVRSGAYLGLALAAGGSLVSSAEPFWIDLGMSVVDGLLAIIIFTIACFGLDAVILRKIKNDERVHQGNLAVGIVENSAYITLGIIVNAAFSGNGQTFWPGMLSAVQYSAIGVVTIMAIYVVFGWLYHFRYRCKVEAEVEQGNVALAVETAGVLLGMGIALWFSISGDYIGWTEDLLSFMMAAVSSVIAVGAAWFISGRALSRVPSVKDGVHQGNLAAAFIRMSALIAFGTIAGLVTFS